ncbi:MAG: hypothetical protein DRJ09_12555 [Bacteroidetes bacterium]|nr:MAG: hypothetical protein DRJ09_12555 [Bacteroidota bacterium]
MTRIISVVLIGKAFLVKAGLEAFLSEFPYVSVVAAFDGSEAGLDKRILEIKPDIVMVNPGNDDPLLMPLLQALSKEPSVYLMALAGEDISTEVQGKFARVANLMMDKMELTNLFKQVLLEKGLQFLPEETDHKLSEREDDILKHVAYGLTNQEIADKLFLSIHTVTTHRKNITRKLGIKTVSGLTVYALMNKLVTPAEIEKRN